MNEQAGGNPQEMAMQLLQENNEMLRVIGSMLQQLMGAEQQAGEVPPGAGGGDEAALREEAMRRLAAQG